MEEQASKYITPPPAAYPKHPERAFQKTARPGASSLGG